MNRYQPAQQLLLNKKTIHLIVDDVDRRICDGEWTDPKLRDEYMHALNAHELLRQGLDSGVFDGAPEYKGQVERLLATAPKSCVHP